LREKQIRVLIVDDGCLCRTLSERLRQEGLQVQETEDAAKALAFIQRGWPDVVLLDTQIPNANGIEMLRRFRGLDSDLPVVMATPSPNFPEAVEAVKAGACDYLAVPFNNDEVIAAVRKAWLGNPRQREFRRGEEESVQDSSLPRLMGPGEKVRQVGAEVSRVAPTNFSVVISGETGVGKELVAQAIHAQSRRAANRFLSVDCGAIPDSLIENELFGHERGAFTSADRVGIGKFEAASGGTLFLDEISNLPLGMQSKLLRVLQEKQIYRIGSNAGTKVNVRMIAATNQDLASLVLAKSFRGDLFHRLSEYLIRVPPLRERREDTLFLAERFLRTTNRELGKDVEGFSDSVIQLLVTYDWPGNVRELRNVIRGAVLLAEGVIGPGELRLRTDASRIPPSSTDSYGEGPLSLKEIVLHSTVQIERSILAQALRRAGGNKAQAARMLGIDYKTIHTKMRQYGIQKEAIHHDTAKEQKCQSG